MGYFPWVILFKDLDSLPAPVAPNNPKRFDLPESFVFLETNWGSLFYQNFGPMDKPNAQLFCSQFGKGLGRYRPDTRTTNLKFLRTIVYATLIRSFFAETTLA